MSLVTRKLFVTIRAGFLNSARTSRQPLVRRSRLSIGWYGSVTPLKARGWGFQRRDASLSLRRADAFSFTMILDSKSSPADMPKNSWPGRA